MILHLIQEGIFVTCHRYLLTNDIDYPQILITDMAQAANTLDLRGLARIYLPMQASACRRMLHQAGHTLNVKNQHDLVVQVLVARLMAQGFPGILEWI